MISKILSHFLYLVSEKSQKVKANAALSPKLERNPGKVREMHQQNRGKNEMEA